MNKYKTISILLLGMLIGMGYTVSCGSGGGSAALLELPGVRPALAQSRSCNQWELQGLRVMDEYALLPEGWTPLGTQGGNAYWVWITRCVAE